MISSMWNGKNNDNDKLWNPQKVGIDSAPL